MEIDIAVLKYTLKLHESTGRVINLSNLYTSMSWGDDQGSIAQKATITIANTKTELGYLSDIIKLLSRISIYANNDEVFQGMVWEWNYTGAQQKEISITAYDALIYTTQCKDNFYFPQGDTTLNMITSICKEWDIPLSYKWISRDHNKTIFNRCEISRMLTNILDEAQTKETRRYVLLMINGILCVREWGSNQSVFILDVNNVIQTQDSLTMTGLVTQVIVNGKENSEGRPSTVHTETGNTAYGLLREIIVKDANATIADAQAEAKKIIEERGRPKESIRVRSVDAPYMRKGDKCKLVAGNLSGYFYVEGVTHSATDKTMDLILSRKVGGGA